MYNNVKIYKILILIFLFTLNSLADVHEIDLRHIGQIKKDHTKEYICFYVESDIDNFTLSCKKYSRGQFKNEIECIFNQFDAEGELVSSNPVGRRYFIELARLFAEQ